MGDDILDTTGWHYLIQALTQYASPDISASGFGDYDIGHFKVQ